MVVVLQVTTGPSAGRKAYLRPGQVLRVGRTEWADFNVPRDAAMSDVHFALECDAWDCRIRDLNSQPGTLLNGEKVTEASVRHGDEITAGQTKFSIHMEDIGTGGGPGSGTGSGAGVGTSSASGLSRAAAKSGYEKVVIGSAAEVCTRYELDEAAAPLLEKGMNVRQFYEALVANKRFPEAARFLANSLPKREAVWWSAQVARAGAGSSPRPTDVAAIEAAEAWATDPSEDRRQKAVKAADATKFDTASGWSAAAAAWSGGSLSAPGLPEVPPADHLTPQAVFVTINMSTVAGEPSKAPARFEEYLELGAEVADGANRWPEKKK